MSADLVVLVPDKDIEQSLRGLLAHPEKLGTRSLAGIEVLVHPNRDPGVYNTGHELISSYAKTHQHALLLLDFDWQGRPVDDPALMAAHIERNCRSAWNDRARCVVINPEVEVWVWSDSPHVAKELGWGGTPELRDWLRTKQLWPAEVAKPPDPKRAFESALRQKKIPPSSAIFKNLAERVSYKKCSDASFNTLLAILREWFSPSAPASTPP